MASKFPDQLKVPGIISQPKADIILKSFGLGLLKPKIYGDIEQEEQDEFDGVSKFGTAVFDNIILFAPAYLEPPTQEDIEIAKSFGNTDVLLGTQKVLSGNIFVADDVTQNQDGKVSNIQRPGDVNAFLINTALIEVSQQRNIITTPIAGLGVVNGRGGTVKEYISENDYSIKIRGFIESNSPGKAPRIDLGILSSYFKAPVALEVASNYLRAFDITRIVVVGYNFPQTEGQRNLQFFEVDCISDFEPEKIFINA